MANSEVHVVPKDNAWEVKASGEQTARRFNTQEQAIEAGREIAKRQQKELVIHAADGSIRAKDSYGNDPRDVPG